MSKNKGTKNKKKAKAEKNPNKKKKMSAYQAEGNKQPALEVFTPNSENGPHKK